MWHTWRGDSGYIPGLSLDGHGYSGIHGYSDKGGGEGWSSLVTVTLASVDTLTWGGRVDIPGLSMDGHCYSGIRGYSDKGGGRVDIPGLSMDGHGCSGIRGYSDKGGGGGKGGHPWTIHGWSQLLWHARIL